MVVTAALGLAPSEQLSPHQCPHLPFDCPEDKTPEATGQGKMGPEL